MNATQGAEHEREGKKAKEQHGETESGSG